MKKTGHWYLLTGLILGLGLGLLYAWWISPATLQDNASPASLRADFQDEYRLLTASAYAANGNLARARARLSLLGGDPLTGLAEQTQRLMAASAPAESVRLLAALAQGLQVPPSEAAPLSGGEAATPLPLPSARPTATLDETAFAPPVTQAASRAVPASPTLPAVFLASPTPRLERAPSATPGAPFALLEQASFCAQERPGLLEIILRNAAGDPAAGIPVTITWPGGEETFFTGLKPDLGGNGYADFVMTPGVEYVLQLSENLTRITGLQAPDCSSAGGAYPGGIHLEFQQP
ncbi:MAG: hypothetical protein Fur0035_16160 [Anaerolineales bacterium]